MHTVDSDLELQLRGYRLTTAEILYRMPDHRTIFQTFIWQRFDLPPKFPKLIKFLEFWSHNLDGPLADVRVMHAGIVQPTKFKFVGTEFRLQ